MATLKELSDQISKAMEGAYQEEWSIDRFKSEITGDDWGLIVCDGTIIAEIRGALDYCGNGENAEYIIATQPKNMRVILSALADAERERDQWKMAAIAQQGVTMGAEAELSRAEAKLAEAVKVLEYIAGNDFAFLKAPTSPPPKGYPGHLAGVARSFLSTMKGEAK